MNEEEEYEEGEGEKEKKEQKNLKKVIENKDKKDEKIQVNDLNSNRSNIYNDINKSSNENKERAIQENNISIELKKSKEKEDKKLAFLFNKKLKKYDKLSQKVDLVLSQIQLSKKRKSEDNNKNMKSQDKILLEKEMQIKNSLAMIHNLTKENQNLKEQLDNLNSKLLPSDDSSLLEQIASKNTEIEKLKKKVVELSKKYDEVKIKNKTYETQINQSKEIINRYKIRIYELKAKNENSHDFKIKLPIKPHSKDNKLLKSSSQINLKKFNKTKNIHELLNNNFYQLLTDKERNSLRNLFGKNEKEFVSFNNKLNILENRNKNAEKQFESEIEILNQIVKNKEIQIENLNKEIEKKDKKINTLENKLNELKMKNKMISRSQRRLLTIEQQLRESGFNITNSSNKDKIDKLNILVNIYKEELDKNYIEKCKEEEINSFNKELGDIRFFDSKFFNNLTKTKNNNIINSA